MAKPKVFIAYGNYDNSFIFTRLISFWVKKTEKLMLLNFHSSANNNLDVMPSIPNPFIELINCNDINEGLLTQNKSDGLILFHDNQIADSLFKESIMIGKPVVSIETNLTNKLLSQEFILNEDNLEEILSFFTENIFKINISAITHHFKEHSV